MSLWGSSNAQVNIEPKFLANTATPYGDIFKRYGKVYADESGWWIIHPSNPSTVKAELLVAIDRLADKLGPALINEVWFHNTGGTFPANGVPGLSNTTVTLDANVAWNVRVAYTQQVWINTATAPKLNVIQSGAVSSNVVATFASGNGNNMLIFNFTTPADFQGNSNGNVVMTITDQPLAVAAGLIVGVSNTSMNANTLIPTAANTPYPFTTRTPTLLVQHPITTSTSLNFATATAARNAASNLFVTFSGNVNVLTTALPNLTITVAAGNTTNAIYASGNGTNNLRFSWTVGQFVANVASITFGSTLKNGSVNDVSANAAVNTYISSTVATAAGIVTPT